MQTLIGIAPRQARELLAIFEDIKETYPMQSAVDRADRGIEIVREILGFGTLKGDIDES